MSANYIDKEMTMSLAILHDHRAINIATVILVTISGLYAYSGLLGRPGGILRQLLVGIPYGVVLGISSYYFDVVANNILSHTFRELIQTPSITVSPITIGILAFVGGVTFPLLSPNFFRDESQRQRLSVVTIALLFLFTIVSGTLWNAIGIQALLQMISPRFGIHIPVVGVTAGALILTAGGFYYSYFYMNPQLGLLGPAKNATPVESPQPPNVLSQASPKKLLDYASYGGTVDPAMDATPVESPQSSNDMSHDETPPLSQSCRTCLISLVILIPAISLWIYFVSVVGWLSLFYFVILFITGGIVYLIQLSADHLKKRHLQVISLVLFVLAAGLQLYQAAAL
jgi:hypothetical protein